MAVSKALTLSIIIPAYNEENHLKACLDSIADQTVAPDEVIVVDNNSTDETAQIAKSFSFVKLVKESRQGKVFARDRGFNAAKSSLIGRIDADTVLPKDWVAKIRAFYADPTHRDQVLTGGGRFYNLRLGSLWGWWQGQFAFRMNRLLLGHHIIYGSNAAIPRKLWLAVRPKVCHDLEVHEDLDLAIHLHRLGYKIHHDESLKVGVKMRRVFENHDELWANMYLWPMTLRRHGLSTWVFGWIGAVVIYAFSYTRPLFRKA